MNSRMYYLLGIEIFLLISIKSFGQTDELREKYNSLTGSEKLEAGFLVAAALEDSPDEMVRFSKELVQLAVKESKNSILHAKSLKALSDGYYYSDSINISNKYLYDAIRIAEKIEPTDTFFLGSAYNDLGMNLQNEGKLKEAEVSLAKAISILEKSGIDDALADAKSNLATLYHSKGNYEQAIRLFQEVYELDVKTEKKDRQSSSLNSLGRMYVDWKKYETGLDFYFQSVELLDSIQDRKTLAIRYNNIGMVYQLMQKHAEAIEWIGKAKKIEETEGEKLKVAIRSFNLATSYAALKKFDEAKQYYLESLAVFSVTNLHAQTSKIFAGLGQLYFMNGQYNLAYEQYNKALEQAEKSGTLPEKSNIYSLLYQYYRKQNQFEKALTYNELYHKSKDSVFNLNVSKQMEEMQAQYQTAQKEAEITRLESENEIKQTELQFRKRERNWALAGVILLFAVSVSMYALFATVKKQKSELGRQNSELDRLNKTLNKLFGIISHDLRNATAAYQSSAKIIGHHLQKGQPEKLLPLAPEIDKNARQLSAMLENLLNWSAIQIKGIQPEKELVVVKTVVDEILSMFSEVARSKNNQINVEINDENVWCDPESFHLIVLNLIGNALKFTSSGKVKISASMAERITTITVSDSGCGMEAAVLENLKNSVLPESKRGTSGEKGTGLGLTMVYEHIRKNGGNIDIESVPEKGTVVQFYLPAEKL